jgi:2-polyprenyl-3-methyl-5-hydroxy-6-metoxy-1,4-benzoquinol methylase
VSARSSQIAGAIQAAQRISRSWTNRSIPDDPRHVPWMPYQIFDFLALLLEAIPDISGDRFLDIGAGAGPYMLLAREIAGLDVHGFDISDEMTHAARMADLDVETADAVTWSGYGDYDLIWFNRPLRDREMQAALEQRVWMETAPGTVVMCANLEAPPPSAQWFPVLDDWDGGRRGIWLKPPAPDGD